MRLPKPKDRRPRTWTPKFVLLRVLRIEDPRRCMTQWGIVVLDMMEHRYSATQGRTLWRFPK